MNLVAAVTRPIVGALVRKAGGECQLLVAHGAALAFIAPIVTRFLPSGPQPKPTRRGLIAARTADDDKVDTIVHNEAGFA